MNSEEIKAMPDAVLADHLGTLDSNAKLLAAEIKKLKAEVKVRQRKLEGNTYSISVSESVRWSLDTALIKDEMSEEWVTAHSKTAYVQTVQIRSNAQQVAA